MFGLVLPEIGNEIEVKSVTHPIAGIGNGIARRWAAQVFRAGPDADHAQHTPALRQQWSDRGCFVLNSAEPEKNTNGGS